MKKIKYLLAALLSIVIVLSCVSCGEDHTDDNTDTSGSIVTADSKVLVVYFSCTNTTKGVAEAIHHQISGSDIYQIVPAIPYTSADLNYNTDCRANREQNDSSARPEINGKIENIEQYDAIFIGYPIWWGTMPRIINTFLDTYDLSDKVIMPFCTSGGSGISKSVSDIKAAEPSARVNGGLKAGGASDSAISRWLKDNGF